jgi:hypothetical protein
VRLTALIYHSASFHCDDGCDSAQNYATETFTHSFIYFYFFSDEFTLCVFSLEIVFFLLFSATEKSYAKENLLKAIHLREARDFIYF